MLGASGLIGQGVAEALMRGGYPVIAVARRFTAAQRWSFGAAATQAAFVGFDAGRLADLLADADVVLNCVGALQDGPRGAVADVHAGFAQRLIAALQARPAPALLLQLSIPRDARTDSTAFSRSKREAEALIAGSGLPHAILRPGFVIAPAAFGGGALMRALAALPIGLDAATERRPLAVTALADIVASVEAAPRLWAEGRLAGGAVWDVMARQPASFGDVATAFRRRFGGPTPRLRLPGWLMRMGAAAGDVAGWLGWSPPIRSTALAELRRGVEGDPTAWSLATGIEPATLEAALAAVPGTVQEAWFGRLYLLKPLVIGGLAAYWALSGAIALGPGFAAAVSALTMRSIPPVAATPLTAVTALADIAVGLGITTRRTCRTALIAGVALSLSYLAAASAIAPDLWADPLGPLVKIGPVLALMVAALAILPER